MARHFRLLVLAAVSASQAVGRHSDAQDLAVGTPGLAVHLPATDGKREAEMLASGATLVQGLSTTDPSLRAVRRALMAAGQYGRIVAMRIDAPGRLPHADNLVTTLEIDADALGEAAPSRAECLRVLHPGGTLHVKKGGAWTAATKPMPQAFGEWTHVYGGPDNNMRTSDTTIGPPTGLRWISGPMCMEEGAVANGIRVGSGVAVNDVQLGPWGQELRFIEARNAFNGLPQFAVPIQGSPFKTRPLVVADGRVYTFFQDAVVRSDGKIEENKAFPLVALDKTTGEVIRTYKNALPFYWVDGMDRDRYAGTNLTVANQTLYETTRERLLAIDAETGLLRWSQSADEGASFDLPCYDATRKLVLVAQGRFTRKIGRNAKMSATHVIAFNAATGKETWRSDITRSGEPDWNEGGGKQITQITGVPEGIFLYRSGGISALKVKQSDTQYLASLDPRTGAVLWAHEGWDHADRRDPDNPKVFDVGGQKLEMSVMDGKVYLMSGGVAAFDAATGKKVLSFDFGNSRCDASHAAGNLLALGFGNYVSLATPQPQVFRSEVVRGHCATGVFPAYGLIYGTPSRCRCAAVLQGYMALSSESAPEPLPEDQRLVRGPAFAAPAQAGSPADWSSFLSSASRNSYSSSSLKPTLKQTARMTVAAPLPAKSSPLATEWRLSAAYPGPVSAPVIAGRTLYVAIPFEHRIEAWSARAGAGDKPLWSFSADARIDSPPSVVGSFCVFGSRDGQVYCLDAESGQLRWKFLAAPARLEITAYGGLESAWPVFGSVPVVETPAGQTVVAFAGYHPETNGGIYGWGLHAATGKVLWKRQIQRPREWSPALGGKADQPSYIGARASGGYNSNNIVNSLPVASGSLVSIQGFVLDAASGSPTADVRSAAGERGRIGRPLPGPVDGAVPVRMPFRLEFNETSPERSSLYVTFRGPGHHNGTWSFSRRNEESGAHFSLDAYRVAFTPDASRALLIPNAGWRGIGDLALYDTTKGAPGSKMGNNPLFTVARNDKWERVALAMTPDAFLVAERRLGDPMNDVSSSARLELRAMADGKLLETVDLPAPPLENGLAVAKGAVYVTCTDGTILRFGE